MSPEIQARARQYRFAILFGLLFFLTMIVHEGGHFLVGHSQGCEPHLSYKNVGYSKAARPGSSDLLRLAAGPVFELILTVIGIAGLSWRRKSPLRVSGPGIWIFTTLTAAGFRWFRTFPRWSDETRMSVLLGWHHLVLPFILLPIAITALVVLVRFHRRNRSMGPLWVNWGAIALSLVIWMFVVGPEVMPER
ncbi:hypothetical protein [Luteolibacter sp. Populi]|uniref:hypothetical protein n=1 Tax=Luteolibacter sp. Populi TaxID=3230487 RepID=UPI00346506D4